MTTTDTTRYLLPCAPSFKRPDRFNILDDSEELEDANGQVPFWPLLTTLLKSSFGPAKDYHRLKSFIGDLQPSFFDELWPVIVRLALNLLRHFPSGSLQLLGDDGFAAIGSSPVPLCPIEVVAVDNYQTCPTQLGMPSGAAVVSVNRFVGFGQSATQEELLIVKGVEAVLNIIGKRRGIKIAAQEVGGSVDWRQRAMLFMDASELDVESDENGLPDLAPQNLIRDLNKAMIAFCSGSYEVIYSPLWGCGAFGGDPFVKLVLLWCAASVAHTSLKIICGRDAQEITLNLNNLISAARKRHETAQGLNGLLLSIPQKTARRHLTA
ncbi:hypothetical protein FHL15_006761 [Xylaria flabelliformis]|uniref:PARG catalytic Macro domain-containing protein n=1 Tax=Xylaria flabelliformis TaxID=2512241 RepID=A0A553HWP9_9PEZI|nr:hypothetical protein FHL15_006761 [Xylaria flabelliformis]